MKKESLILIALFLILSVLMHYNQWLLSPIEQIKNLNTSGAYGLGVYHPFIFTLLVYVILLLPRSIFKLFRKK